MNDATIDFVRWGKNERRGSGAVALGPKGQNIGSKKGCGGGKGSEKFKTSEEGTAAGETGGGNRQIEGRSGVKRTGPAPGEAGREGTATGGESGRAALRSQTVLGALRAAEAAAAAAAVARLDWGAEAAVDRSGVPETMAWREVNRRPPLELGGPEGGRADAQRLSLRLAARRPVRSSARYTR